MSKIVGWNIFIEVEDKNLNWLSGIFLIILHNKLTLNIKNYQRKKNEN